MPAEVRGLPQNPRPLTPRTSYMLLDNTSVSLSSRGRTRCGKQGAAKYSPTPTSSDPENPKFRKIRMSNPKIREAVGDVAGGIELLDIVRFELKEEDGEMWAVMEVPGKDRLDLIGNAIMSLETKKLEKSTMTGNAAPADSSAEDKPTDAKSIDRQIKVFFSVPENIAARIELPDSFYCSRYEEEEDCGLSGNILSSSLN